MQLNKFLGFLSLSFVFMTSHLISYTCFGVKVDTLRRVTDTRQFRSLTLKNDLEVLLISDPYMNKAAGAMDVRVGSLEDPEEYQGLAHFLEHMLFLGTKKYPNVEEYGQYLAMYQGSSNAYTADESTNYQFEVAHEGFDGALDRFAQFFIEPLFNSEFVNREMKAVNSEHEKNLQSDMWRSDMVSRTLHKVGHPQRKFNVGNIAILEKVSRETLLNFYQKYYSANVMKLTVMSKLPLDQLEASVREKFSEIANSKRKNITYDTELFDSKDLPRTIFIKPVKDVKTMSLVFAAPDKEPYWKSKPIEILSFLIGYEGKGSLLSLLKEKNYATALSAGFDPASFSGLFHINMDLTDNGLEHRDEVVHSIFSFMKLLKKEGYKKFLYEERKKMAEINFKYRDNVEGMMVASNFASRMQFQPGLKIEENDSLIHEYSEKDFFLFLDKLVPEQLNLYITSKDVKTDKVEPYYGTEYAVEKIGDDKVKKWNTELVQANLAYPLPNKFIPEKLDLISLKEKTKPEKIIDNELGIFWSQLDDEFKLPKVSVKLLLFLKDMNKTPESAAKTLLYVKAINEALNEWLYDVDMAGLGFLISYTDRGLQMEFFGFSEKLPYLMRELAQKLKSLDSLDEKRLESIKEKVRRSIKNKEFDAAYEQLLYELKHISSNIHVHRNAYYDPDKKIDHISPITLASLKDFAAHLYDEVAFEGSAYGNIAQAELRSAVEDLVKIMKSKILAKDKRLEESVVDIKEKSSQAFIMSSSANNNAYISIFYFGARTPQLDAAMRLGQAVLGTPFYDELRTKQQLGYIVHSSSYYADQVLRSIFLIQSPGYDPFEIGKRIKKWTDGVGKLFDKLSEDEFAKYRNSVVEKLLEKEKTIAERHERLAFETITMKGHFDYRDRVVEEVKKLSKEAVKKIFVKALSEKSKAALVGYLKSSSVKRSKRVKEHVIKDVEQFRKSAQFYQGVK